MRSAYKSCVSLWLAAAGMAGALVAPDVQALCNTAVYAQYTDNDDNLHSGVADNDLFAYLDNSSANAPIEFNIIVDGALPLHDATLSIRGFDIDANDSTTVSFNGVVIGALTGVDADWSVSAFEIPPALVVAGANRVDVQFETTDIVKVHGGELLIDQCDGTDGGDGDTGGGDGDGDTGGGDGDGDTGGGDGDGDTDGGDGDGDTGGGDGDGGQGCDQLAASRTDCDGNGDGVDTDNDGVDDDIDLDDDNDGISDLIESDGVGNDVDTDGDGTPDRLDLDTDNDTLSDETESGFPPLTGNDSDHDGLDDAVDADVTGGTDADRDGSDDVFVPRNSDDDPLPDFRDPNSDNDDLPDSDEDGDFDNNGVPDYLEPRGNLETAVRGAGSSGVLTLMALGLLAVVRRRKWSLALLAAIASFSAAADQQLCSDKADFGWQVPQCWYIGLGVGASRLDPDDDISEWYVDDKSDFAYKGTIGYHFLPHFFVEASYADLGEAGVRSRNPAVTGEEFVNYKTPSAMLGYLLFDPASRWNVFARIGTAKLDTDAPVVVNHDEETSMQLAVGAGIQLRFAERWFARLEVDSYDKDARAAYLSLNRYFGAAKAAPQAAAPAPQPAPAPVVAPAPAKPSCKQFSGVLKGVNFATASAELDATAQSALGSVVGSLNEFPQMHVDIAAHTDWRGTEGYNLRLGQRRADSVVSFLQQGGIAAGRMQAKSFGESQPIADNNTEEGRAQNRRVEIHPQNTQQCVPSAP